MNTVTINLPFGGLHESGMGYYCHGYKGIATFYKLRPVFYQAGFSVLKYLLQPFGKLANRVTSLVRRVKS